MSCGSYQYHDNYYALDHRNDNNQCFFVVDTIDIPNPILIKEKGDYFIVSQTALEKGTKSIDNLYHETDVYIAGFEEFFFYKYLPKEAKDLVTLCKQSFYLCGNREDNHKWQNIRKVQISTRFFHLGID